MLAGAVALGLAACAADGGWLADLSFGLGRWHPIWSWHGAASILWITLLLAPFLEELIFRCGLQGALREGMGATASIMLSTLVFAVSHEPTEPLHVISGVLLGLIYERTRSVLASFIIHAAINCASVGTTTLLALVGGRG